MHHTAWLAQRAVLALVLMVGFYALALTIAALLIWIPYAEWVYLDRFDLRLAAGCIVTALGLLVAVWPRRDAFVPPGPELTPDSSPKLFAMLADLARDTGQSIPEHVYLIGDVNAWVSNRGGVMGFGSRRVMGIGLPLVQGLTVNELRAVVAHEFGHYSAGDVALGPLIYKTRSAIARTVEAFYETPLLDKVFEAYGRFFMRLTLAVSRQQEFVADALAARIAGAPALVSALRKLDGLAVAHLTYWREDVAPALRVGVLPPVGSGFERFLRASRIAALWQASIDSPAQREASPSDTHPPLIERVEALNALAPSSASSPAALEQPARALLADIDGHARELLIFANGPTAIERMQSLKWEDVGEHVWPKVWRAACHQHARFFASLPEPVPVNKDLLAKLGQVLDPPGEIADRAGRTRNAVSMIGTAFALALAEAGYAVVTAPGEPVRLIKGDETVDPWGEIGDLVAGTASVDEWRSRCQLRGIRADWSTSVETV